MQITTTAVMAELLITDDEGKPIPAENEDALLDRLEAIPQVTETGYLTGRGPFVVVRFHDCQDLQDRLPELRARIRSALKATRHTTLSKLPGCPADNNPVS